MIAGLTRYVNGGHIARAALEATAFQSREVVDAMIADSGVALESLKVDGGMMVNETADAVPGRRARRAGGPPEGARDHRARRRLRGGAGESASGHELGELRENWAEDRRWEPTLDASAREEALRFWKKAVERTFDWVE